MIEFSKDVISQIIGSGITFGILLAIISFFLGYGINGLLDTFKKITKF